MLSSLIIYQKCNCNNGVLLRLLRTKYLKIIEKYVLQTSIFSSSFLVPRAQLTTVFYDVSRGSQRHRIYCISFYIRCKRMLSSDYEYNERDATFLNAELRMTCVWKEIPISVTTHTSRLKISRFFKTVVSPSFYLYFLMHISHL